MSETSHLWAVIESWLDVLPWPPTQSQLAKKLGVSRQAVTEWKYGLSVPKPEHLRALADEMAAVAGPDVYDRLLDAVNLDQGFEPRRRLRA
jgi:transcriptional regulator with XRE-family HTH domain